jgi:hypothetical protein
MKRIQLFEFEDFNWFPDWTRSSLTKLIVILHNMMGLGDVVATLIAKTLKDQNLSSIVDLGSGAGGPMPEVVNILQEKHFMKGVQLLMTDFYPNPEAIKKFNTDADSNLSYAEDSIDATTLGSAPEGLKTMVNCFHHMPPDKARKILSSAQENGQSLLIYEMAENKMPLLVWWLLLPLSLVLLFTMTLFMIPFVKPLTWREIVFTYIIPIIPITYAWDGQASMPRMYSMNDLDELTKDLKTENYHWEKGYGMNSKNKKMGTYLLGRLLN